MAKKTLRLAAKAAAAEAVTDVLRDELLMRGSAIGPDIDNLVDELREDIDAAVMDAEAARDLIARIPERLEEHRIHVSRGQWSFVRRSLEIGFRVAVAAVGGDPAPPASALE